MPFTDPPSTTTAKGRIAPEGELGICEGVFLIVTKITFSKAKSNQLHFSCLALRYAEFSRKATTE